MSELVFSTYLNELKNAWAETVADPDLIQLLYDGIANPLGLLNKDKSVISVEKGAASKIVNRKKGGNALKAIRTGASKKLVKESIEQYFEKNVVKRLHPDSVDDLLAKLKEKISNDPQISDNKKSELIAWAGKEHLAKFLSAVYLYSLTRDNVLQNIREQSVKEMEEYKKHPLTLIPAPANVIDEEKKYAEALMEVYGQAERVKGFDESLLVQYPKHQKHFSEQRAYYYAAEAVRRGTRDIYSNEDQFEVLKKETFEGVKEVWEEEYKNGYTRLRRVMAQAALTRIDKCWLSRDTDWVGNPEKKGVCHFLVKDGKLEGWVRDDDEQAL